MNAPLLATLAFVSAFSGILALEWLLFDVVLRDRRRIHRRLSGTPRGAEAGRGLQKLFKNLDRVRHDTRSQAAVLAGKSRLFVEQSGTRLTLRDLFHAALALAAAGALASAWLLRSWWLTPLISIAAGLLPVLYVQRCRSRRMMLLRRQLPEAFDHLVRSVRGGQTMEGAFQVISSRLPAPLGDEFAFCGEQQQLGLEYDIAFRDLGRRTGVLELHMFAVAMLVQRRLGGSPVEVLTSLAGLVRKRLRMEARIKLLTSEGRLQALVLLLLPGGAFFSLWFLDRSYLEPLLARPAWLWSCIGSLAVGYLWIRKMVRVDY